MASATAEQSTSLYDRSSSLDGLRGLAALTVVVLHLLSVFWGTDFRQYSWVDHFLQFVSYTPISALWAGSSAVVLFFILSGYALERMLSPESMTYAAYAARRIARLWIPYAATVILASISICLIGSHKVAGQSDWMNSSLGTPLSVSMLRQHMLMVGEFDTRPIDFVIWSLVIEMRMSLIFPLIHRSLKYNRPILLLIFSILIGGMSILAQHRWGASSVSMIATLSGQTYFVIGALIAKYEAHIRRQYVRIPTAYRVLLFLFALTLYSGCLPVSATYGIMLGATWIIVVALCSAAARRMLDCSAIQWLGEVSYSLYLCHVVVLLSLINLLYPRLSFTSIVVLAVPAIYAVSVLLHRFVERPAMVLGRTIGRQLGGTSSKSVMTARVS
jgi:peptidoglycan/LPS O-acetylase OafA/YrhL